MLVEITWLVLAHRGQPIPLKEFEFIESYQDWIDCGLAHVSGGELVHVAGADRYAEFFSKQSENGKKGGRPKQSQKKPKQTQTKPKKPSSSSSSSGSISSSSSDSLVSESSAEPPNPAVNFGLNAEIWKSYSDAYFARYGTDPVRNAKVNAQVSQLAKRLGSEAPDIARFYVAHNKAFYVSKTHELGLCLSDAESLRTQWATGRTVTQRQAQHADDAAAMGDQLRRIREGKL